MAERKAGQGTPAPKAAPDGEAEEAETEAPAKRKVCFVATPIGPAGSDTRKRANQIQRHIINPCVQSFGYDPIRADEITQPGMIPRQIIQYLLDADLVVIDLSEYNPNVYYEMAIRHMVGKPIVHLMERDKPLPFDVQQNRTIFVDVHDLDSVADCRVALEAQIRALEADPTASDNPISYAVDYTAVRGSNNPQERVLASLLNEVEQIGHRLDGQLREPPMLDAGRAAFRNTIERVDGVAAFLADSLTQLKRFEGALTERERELQEVMQLAYSECSDLVRRYGSAVRRVPTVSSGGPPQPSRTQYVSPGGTARSVYARDANAAPPAALRRELVRLEQPFDLDDGHPAAAGVDAKAAAGKDT